MSKERDLYLAELLEREVITQYEFRDLVFKPEINAFDSNYLSSWFIDKINFGWSAWQAAKAQAVPEGFSVVPIETLDEALSWANCASSESWSDAQREEIDKHYRVIEKAMIEARAVPEGFKLMPLKATENMVEAACDISEADESWSFYDIYEAMVSSCEP